MSTDWKVPEIPANRKPLHIANKSINYEAATFTQHEKLLLDMHIHLSSSSSTITHKDG